MIIWWIIYKYLVNKLYKVKLFCKTCLGTSILVLVSTSILLLEAPFFPMTAAKKALGMLILQRNFPLGNSNTSKSESQWDFETQVAEI